MQDNQPTELTNEKDFFGHLIKAEAVKNFLEANIDSLGKNRMFALYGEWGSGKSSIMLHLEKELNEGDYFPIFFEAWQHEKDNNLSLSLLNCIADNLTDEVFTGELFLSYAKCILKGVQLPFFNFSEIIKGGEEECKKLYKALSERDKVIEFKEKFVKAEKKLLEEKKKKKIIVFIDDLDRCEPENVLNLLSHIKLFFTYGEETIFFFGVDKDAISRAVQIRYGNSIQAEVYLEKVFDISFNVPKVFNFAKLIKHYFPNHSQPDIFLLEKFFVTIDFTIPRHLKKVLNKYEILKKLRDNKNVDIQFKKLVPNTENNILELILVLYFIILYEFNIGKFIETENYDEKFISYARAKFNATQNSPNQTIASIVGTLDNLIRIKDVKKLGLTELKTAINHNNGRAIELKFQKFLTLFLPRNIETYEFIQLSDQDYIKQFESQDSKIMTNFCKFLLENQNMVLDNLNSTYHFGDFFEMAKTLL